MEPVRPTKASPAAPSGSTLPLPPLPQQQRRHPGERGLALPAPSGPARAGSRGGGLRPPQTTGEAAQRRLRAGVRDPSSAPSPGHYRGSGRGHLGPSQSGCSPPSTTGGRHCPLTFGRSFAPASEPRKKPHRISFFLTVEAEPLSELARLNPPRPRTSLSTEGIKEAGAAPLFRHGADRPPRPLWETCPAHAQASPGQPHIQNPRVLNTK